MNDILVELDYIRTHFPDFVLSIIPKILIGLIILQIVLGLIKFIIRTVSVILWIIIIVLMGADLYYYIMHIRLHEIALYLR